jgi:hypothetical protein
VYREHQHAVRHTADQPVQRIEAHGALRQAAARKDCLCRSGRGRPAIDYFNERGIPGQTFLRADWNKCSGSRPAHAPAGGTAAAFRLNKIAVSDRGTLRVLTQFWRTPFSHTH